MPTMCTRRRCPGGSRRSWRRGPEVFGGSETVKEYEDRIGQLERMLGQKEVEIALLKTFFGSSSVWLQSTREGGFDLEDEVGIIAEAVGLTFDDLDAVVHALEPSGVDRVASMIDDALLVGTKHAGEAPERTEAAGIGQVAPAVESLPG